MKKIFHKIKNLKIIHNTLKMCDERVEAMFGRKMLLTGLLILVVLVSGCGGQKKPASTPKKQNVSIGVSVVDMQRNGNEAIKKMLEEQAKKDQAKITWLDAKGDPTQQQRDIQKLIEEKVKVVILQISDPLQGAELVDTLATNNIKVIALESLPYNTPVDAYITSDHSRTGSLQVHYLETLMKQAQQYIEQGQVVLIPQQQSQGQDGQQSGGQQQGQQPMTIPAEQQMAVNMQGGKPIKVLVLEGDPNDQMALGITGAVNSELQNIDNVEVVLTQPHPRWDVNLAMGTMQQLLSDKKEFDVVLANDSHLAMAAVEALKQHGQDRRVITVGAGADPKSIKALQQGEHDAEVDNRPDLLANLAYQAAKDLAEDKTFAYNSSVANGNYTVPTKVVPPRLIQQQNLYLLEDRMKKVGKQGQGNKQGGQQQSQGQSEQQGGQQQSQGQQQGQGGQQASGQQQSQQGQKQTTLKITTSEGKMVEVQVDGEVQTIESSSGGQQSGQQQGGQQQGSSQGQSSSGGS